MAIRQLSDRKKMSVDEVSERIVKLTELLRSNPEGDLSFAFSFSIIAVFYAGFTIFRHLVV